MYKNSCQRRTFSTLCIERWQRSKYETGLCKKSSPSFVQYSVTASPHNTDTINIHNLDTNFSTFEPSSNHRFLSTWIFSTFLFLVTFIITWLIPVFNFFINFHILIAFYHSKKRNKCTYAHIHVQHTYT